MQCTVCLIFYEIRSDSEDTDDRTVNAIWIERTRWFALVICDVDNYLIIQNIVNWVQDIVSSYLSIYNFIIC